MITLCSIGPYRLAQTKQTRTKVLSLDGDAYAWIVFEDIGEILVKVHCTHSIDCILSVGQYRLYEVDNEPDLNDNQHLELEVGKDVWQGYLLLTGLPTETKKRARIIPTTEIITGNPKFSKQSGLLMNLAGERAA